MNLIANDEGLWPLEFTSRLSYPGFAICEGLQLQTWEEIFCSLLGKQSLALATRSGFASGVVLTVPPFPYRQGYEELSKGAPVCLMDDMDAAQRAALHFAEVALVHGELVTSGSCGYVGVATGVGDTVAQANERALALARRVVVPNLRYRRDIGERVWQHDLQTLARLGWLSSDLIV